MGPEIIGLILFIIICVAWWKRKDFEARQKQCVRDFAPAQPCRWTGKKFLFVVNPRSGEQKGVFILNNAAKPMCKKAGISVDSILTEHANHAFEIGCHLNLSSYDAVIIVSGDGLVSQFLNGCAARFAKSPNPVEEFLEFLKTMPIGILPGGTSNGLCTSLGAKLAFPSMSNIINGSPKPVDICQFKSHSDGSITWDCHVFSWGIVADFDEFVERKLRWMGSLRVLATTLYVIGRKRKYRGRLRFLPQSVGENDFNEHHYYSDADHLQDDEEREGWKVIKDEFVLFCSTNTSDGAHDISFSPLMKLNEGAVDLLILRGTVTRFQLLMNFFRFAAGTHVEQPEFEVYKTNAFEIRPAKESGIMSVSGETLKYGTVSMKVFEGGAMFVH